MSKKTLVIGASTNPERTSNTAIQRLIAKGHEVIAVGFSGGEVAGVPIQKKLPEIGEEVDTISLYISAEKQPPLYDSILALKPKRLIFNPGAENKEFMNKLYAEGVKTEEACTLVLLSLDQY